MVYSNTPRKETLRSLADASHTPFWLDDPSRPTPEPELARNTTTDLLIIGAGHVPILRFLAQSSPEYRLREPSEFLSTH